MFIDDERTPDDVFWIDRDVYDNKEWVICRNSHEVNVCIKHNGMPSFISFDHDLGENEDTGYDIAKSLVDLDMDNKAKFSPEFGYVVHSKNPIGSSNIKNYLDDYLKKFIYI
jgi:hypothetical protein